MRSAMSENRTYLEPKLIAQLCLQKYNALPKNGKAKANEWTVLAGIVLHDCQAKSSEVVAIGTGTKCIGAQRLCPKGLILNDSHAEMMARRALLRFLYDQISKVTCKAEIVDTKPSTIFRWNACKNVFCLKENISFHFFCTHTPCGDACIMPAAVREADNDKNGEPPPNKRQKTCEQNRKNAKSSIEDIVGHQLISNEEKIYTGAKIINYDGIAPIDVVPDKMLQVIGVLRTKPGRGDRSLSMSCSDKISKWCLLGVQGALIDMLLEKPIYLETLTIYETETEEALMLSNLKRSFIERWNSEQFFESNRFTRKSPKIQIYSGDLKFEHLKSVNKQASACGIVWSKVPDLQRPLEVCVNGQRLGVVKKALNTPQAALQISKFHLLQAFVNLIKSKADFFENTDFDPDNVSRQSYASLKSMSKSYQEAWSSIKRGYFKHWTEKPKHLVQFSVESVLEGTEK